MIKVKYTILKFWRRKLKARGGEICQLQKDKLRFAFSFIGQTSFLECKAKKLLKDFLCINLGREVLLDKGRKLQQRVIYIQRKVLDRQACLNAKVEVLLTYWDKLYGKMQILAS